MKRVVEMQLDLGILSNQRVLVRLSVGTLPGQPMGIEIENILWNTQELDVVDLYPMIPQSEIRKLKNTLWSTCFAERVRGHEAAGEVVG